MQRAHVHAAGGPLPPSESSAVRSMGDGGALRFFAAGARGGAGRRAAAGGGGDGAGRRACAVGAGLGRAAGFAGAGAFSSAWLSWV